MKRQAGYYWVQRGLEAPWQIAYYNSDADHWLVVGSGYETFYDVFWDKINESRITYKSHTKKSKITTK